MNKVHIYVLSLIFICNSWFKV